MPAGLSVFLVALPLCLGISLASGAPLYAGLLAGIIGGIIIPLISKSALSVSGPAAGLSTVVAASIASYGDYRIFLLTVIIAGLFQVVLGVLKLGSIANYFPSAVIKGMLAAIGIILISKQIPLAIGYDQPDFWTSGFPTLLSADHFLGNFSNFNLHITRGALLITAVSLLVLIALQQPFAARLKIIPAPLLVVIMAVITNIIFSYASSGYTLKKTQLVNIPDNIFKDIALPNLSLLFSSTKLWTDGVIIGLLATLETLLCIEAVDKLDPHNRITPVNRELIAQGVGNIACGMLGAIPVTSVVVRGAANANAGARSRMAAFTHGVFLLMAVMLVPFLLSMIPYAALAAILLVTGYNLTRPSLYKEMYRLGWKQFMPFILTIVVILSTDLLMGVSIGLLLSVYFIIQNNFKAEYRITKTRKHETEVQQIKLNTNVTFLNKVKFRKALDQVPEYSILEIDGSESNFIDYDILEIISEFKSKAHDRHIEVHLKGIQAVDVLASHH